MNLSLVVIFILAFVAKARCYEKGYSKDTCDKLIPNVEPNEEKLSVSYEACPFSAKFNRSRYRRNREMQITIEGDNVKSFILQVRKSSVEGKRVGEFTKWPAGTKPLECDEGRNSAVTNDNFEMKNNLQFTWKAPDDDEGSLEIFDGYVFLAESDIQKYWTEVSATEESLEFAELPVGVENCEKDKACVRYSDTGKQCDGNNCTYMLTYEYLSNDDSIEITLGRFSKDKGDYAALGLRETKDGAMYLTACIREVKDDSIVVSVKNYRVEAEGMAPVEQTANIEKTSDFEDDSFWCEVDRPVSDAGENAINFDKPLYWVYMWGKMNESSGLPILDDNWRQSENPYNVTDLLDLMLHDSNTASLVAFNYASLLVCLLIILWM